MTGAAQPMKFTFGREFNAPEPRTKSDEKLKELQQQIAELQAEVVLAEQRGHDKGYAAGKRDREAVEAGRLADAMDRLGSAAGALLATLEGERAGLEAEAVALAVACARTLARGLVTREPEAEIVRLAGEVLTHLRNAPHLVLRVTPDLVEPMEAKLKRLAWERGFEGRVVVLGDPDQAMGDCRIEWADGGVVRDAAGLQRAIDSSVARFLGARAAGEQE